METTRKCMYTGVILLLCVNCAVVISCRNHSRKQAAQSTAQGIDGPIDETGAIGLLQEQGNSAVAADGTKIEFWSDFGGGALGVNSPLLYYHRGMHCYFISKKGLFLLTTNKATVLTNFNTSGEITMIPIRQNIRVVGTIEFHEPVSFDTPVITVGGPGLVSRKRTMLGILTASKMDFIGGKYSEPGETEVAPSFNGVLRATVTEKSEENRVALFAASEIGSREDVKALIATGADVNAKADNGYTALMVASQEGQLSVVKELLAAKANVNAKAGNGATPLMLASQEGKVSVVRELLAAKADINAQAGTGASALMFATENGSPDVVEDLLAAKADVNAKTGEGATALILASLLGRPEIVKVLIAAKADLSARTSSGETALAIASRKGHQEVVQLLRKAGAKE